MSDEQRETRDEGEDARDPRGGECAPDTGAGDGRGAADSADAPSRRAIVRAGWSAPVILAVTPPLALSHADAVHGGHADGGHADGGHDDSGHWDVIEHYDSAHNDVDHLDDSAHLDTAHTDINAPGAHVDGGHADITHVDSLHTDAGHMDSNHGDRPHGDTAHVDAAHTDGIGLLAGPRDPLRPWR